MAVVADLRRSGMGKTRTGAEWCADTARRFPGARIALVAPTFADGRDTMVEGESGLLSVFHDSELRGGTQDSAWNRSMGELYLANGSRFKIYSSEKPKQLRGPQFHFAWGDEPAYWNDVEQGTAKDSTWSNLNFALRLPPIPGWVRGYQPRGVLTTTPRRVPLLKVPDETARTKPYMAGLLQRPKQVMVTTGSTMDNLENLAQDYREAVVEPLVGTTLGRQELGGQMLEDVEGALWTQAELDAHRVDTPAARLQRVVVSFDPAGGGGFGHDEHGIIVAGSIGTKRHLDLYALQDLSLNGTPNQAARRCILAYLEWNATSIVYEKNQGQDWIPTTIESVWASMTTRTHPNTPPELAAYEGQHAPRMEYVTAVKSKAERATPVAGLYQQGKAHHVGTMSVLEGQLTTWVPGDSNSPDRLDALVWAMTWLYDMAGTEVSVASAARDETRRGRAGQQAPAALPAVYDSRRTGRR